MFEYDEFACCAAKVLDKYNFKEEIFRCRSANRLSPYDIREYLEFENGLEVTNALEELSIDEFMEYLTETYGVYWDEIIEYRMR